MTTFKLHNFIIACTAENMYDSFALHDRNNMCGRPYMYLQENLHVKQQNDSNERNDLNDVVLRDSTTRTLHSLEYTRNRHLILVKEQFEGQRKIPGPE